MRVLVWPRHDADLAHNAFLVDLAGSAIGAGPLRYRPAPDALLVGKRDFVVFAVVIPGLLGPGFLDDFEVFLIDPAVVAVDRRAIHRRAGHVVLLSEHIDPAVLITAGEASIDPPFSQLIENGELLGVPDRVPRRQYQPERR